VWRHLLVVECVHQQLRGVCKQPKPIVQLFPCCPEEMCLLAQAWYELRGMSLIFRMRGILYSLRLSSSSRGMRNLCGTAQLHAHVPRLLGREAQAVPFNVLQPAVTAPADTGSILAAVPGVPGISGHGDW